METNDGSGSTDVAEVLGRITDGVVVLDAEWRFVYANDRGLELLERSRDGLLGRVLWDEFPDAVGSVYERRYREAMETQRSVAFEAYYPPLAIWTRVRAHPSETGLTVYLHDVTDRKEREQDLERYGTIFETMEDGVFVTDEAYRFVDANRAFSEMSGYGRDELIGSRVSLLLDDDAVAAGARIGEEVVASDSKVGVLEADLRTADGGSIPVESRFVPFVTPEGTIQTVGVTRDVSAHDRHQRTLTALHASSRELLRARSRREICDVIVDTTIDILDFPVVAVYLRDAGGDVLEPAGHSVGFEAVTGPMPVIPTEPGSSITADVFERGETAVFDDVRDSKLLMDPTTRIRSGLFIPLGGHGVVLIGDTEPGVFDADVAELPEILAATAEAALDRVARMREARMREAMVANLHEATRELIHAETRRSIAEVAVDAATRLLEFSSAGVFLWDDRRGVLESAALSDDVAARYDGPIRFDSGNSVAWEAFVDGETRVYDDLHAEADARYNPETPFRSELIVPMGTHGVFLAGSPSIGAYDGTDVECAELLVANTDAALDRTDRDRELREQERRLNHQNEELTRINRLSSVVRRIHSSMAKATSREEIEQRVCDHLAASESYDFAWIATDEAGSGDLVARAWSDRGETYLDALPLSGGDDGAAFPMGRALEAREPVVVDDVLSRSGFDVWRKAALKRGYQSALGLPIRRGNTVYGAIEVYSTRPAAFSGEAYDVFVELGETIGNAIRTVERIDSLLASTGTEIELGGLGADDPLFRFARDVDGRIDVDALVPTASGSWLLYALLDGPEPADVIEVAERYVTIERINHIRSKNERGFFGIALSDLGDTAAFVEQGATVRSLSVEGEEGRVVVRLPQNTDVAAFVDRCAEAFPGVELRRRTPVPAAAEPADVAGEIAARITPRQREAIKLAVESGYFSWPRERTGDEIAAMMGITSPTFHKHLRKGLDAVLRTVVD